MYKIYYVHSGQKFYIFFKYFVTQYNSTHLLPVNILVIVDVEPNCPEYKGKHQAIER